jgi:hypothetical protein
MLFFLELLSHAVAMCMLTPPVFKSFTSNNPLSALLELLLLIDDAMTPTILFIIKWVPAKCLPIYVYHTQIFLAMRIKKYLIADTWGVKP